MRRASNARSESRARPRTTRSTLIREIAAHLTAGAYESLSAIPLRPLFDPSPHREIVHSTPLHQTDRRSHGQPRMRGELWAGPCGRGEPDGSGCARAAAHKAEGPSHPAG